MRPKYQIIRLLWVLFCTVAVSAGFCAQLNTGSSFVPVFSLYQSVGACTGTCNGYAFAILQGHNCWCSNYSPDIAVSSDACNDPCPGYPIDKCGNSTANFYSYIQIGQSSGVQSASAVLSTMSSTIVGVTATSGASRSIATVTVNRGTTLIITSFVPNEPTITVSSAESDSMASTLRESSAVSTDQPNSSTQSSQITNSTNESPRSFWNSAGKVAGVFVSVGLVLLLLLLGLLWKWRKRKTDEDVEESDKSPQRMARQMSGSQTVSRSTSLLQLLGRRERAPGDDDMSPSSNRLSRSPTDMVIPVVDQRLDPQSMMIRFDDNDSRTSFRDEEDYSRRVWRVTNASDSDSLRSSEVAERFEKA